MRKSAPWFALTLASGILFAAGGTFTAWRGFQAVSLALGKASTASAIEYRKGWKKGWGNSTGLIPTWQVHYSFVDERGVTNRAWSGVTSADPLGKDKGVRYTLFPSYLPMLESEYKSVILQLSAVGLLSAGLLALFISSLRRHSDG